MKRNNFNSYLASVVLAFLSLVINLSCNKSEPKARSETGKYQRELKYACSITTINGVYKIDSNVVLANRNKRELVGALIATNLIDKNNVSEIPDFIKTFMGGISKEQFAMANPGEKYQEGWFDLGKGVPTKQLIYFGLGKNVALFSYYSGGIRRHQNLIILKIAGSRIIDFWFENYDIDVRTKAEMIEYLKTSRARNGNC